MEIENDLFLIRRIGFRINIGGYCMQLHFGERSKAALCQNSWYPYERGTVNRWYPCQEP
jgi:hypothetical protein